MKKRRKLMSLLLSFVMVVTMMPQSAFAASNETKFYRANEIPNGSTIKLLFKTDALSEYQNKSYTSYDESGASKTVTGHNYVDNDGYMEFEMLDKDKTNTGSTSGVFVVSKASVKTSKFNNEQSEGNEYQGSVLQQTMTGIYNDMADRTQGVIMPTTKTDETYTVQSSSLNYSYRASELKGDRSTGKDMVFAMSAKEADRYYTVMGDTAIDKSASDVKRRTPGRNGIWWLRSPWTERIYAGRIMENGSFSTYLVDLTYGVRVACNLTASSIFTSSGDGVYTLWSTDGDEHMVQFEDYTGKLLKAEVVESGKDATPPTPARAGYIFNGWDKSYRNITSDIVLRAKYIRNGNAKIYMANEIPNGSTIRLPFKTDSTTLGKYQNKSYKYYDGSSTKTVTGHNYVDNNGYMEFEMLDSAKTNTGSEAGVYVVSKESVNSGVFLSSSKYKEWKTSEEGDGKYYRIKTDGNWETDAQGNKILANTYQGSDLQASMTGIYNDMASITQSAIMPTTKTDAAYTTESSKYNYSYGTSELKGDKVFAMSGEEADTYFRVMNGTEIDKNASDVKRRTPGADSAWWLRSPYSSYSYGAGNVDADGGFSHYRVLLLYGRRVALNLTASSLFSSSGDGVYTLIDSRNKVEFQDDNGKVLKTDMVKTGDDATAPTDAEMQKTGYTFKGWDRTFTNVTNDMVVKAIYTPIECTVTFEDGNGNVIEQQKVQYGGTAVAPENLPEIEGKYFSSWDKSYSNVIDSITVKAQYTDKECVVKFLDGDGKLFGEAQTVTYGQSATAPQDNPTKTGYTFKGWEDYTNIRADKEIKPIFTPNEYTVKFMAVGNTIETQKVPYGGTAVAPRNVPEVAGKYFSGWDKSYSNIITDVDVTAVYVDKEYVVKFLDGDGKLFGEAQTVMYGKDATAPSSNPTKTGYIFAGWEDYTNIRADKEIKPIFTPIMHTVTFKDAGDNIIETQQVQHGGTAVAPTKLPEIEGKYFSKWDKSYSNITDNTTVTAVYDTLKYRVTFKDETGNVLDTQDVAYGSAATAPEASKVPTKPGYTFSGNWSQKLDDVKSNLEVYPVYAIKTYCVTLNDMNGAPERTLPEVTYIGRVMLSIIDNPGYTFAGWNTKKDGTGVKYDATTYNVSDLPYEDTNELTLFAQWTENTNYMVEYKTNTKAGMENAPKVDSIRDIAWTEYGLIPEGVAVEGYTLDGWYADQGFKKKVNETTTYGDIAKTEKGKVTLYAKWLKNYNVKFYNIEGQETAIFDGYVPEGVFTETVQHGDNKGYEFAGWYTLSAEGEEEFTIGESQITGDTEVYGKWTPVYYTVNFYSNREETETYKTVEALRGWEIPEDKRPANPSVTETQIFECWETADGRAFDLNTEPITENNLNLYGRWAEREDINVVANIEYNQNVEYTGNPITLRELGIKVTLKAGGKVLTKGTDFEVEYEPVEIGDGSFTLKGKGYYNGVTAPKEFTVKDPIVNDVTGLKVASTTGTQIDLKWAAAKVTTKSIAGYNVYEGKNLVAGKLTDTKASIKKLLAGTVHTYTVKAYVTVGSRDIESKGVSVTGITVPAKVVISKVTTKSKTVTVTWGKKTCTKYEVQLATDKKFKKGLKKVTAKASAKTATIKSLKKGTMYYVRVRAVTTSGKMIKNGAWSAVKSIKCK